MGYSFCLGSGFVKTKKLTTSSIMIAIAVVLSFVVIYRLPSGGAVTAASMVPIIMISVMYGTKWGVFSALCYALIQGVVGFYAPPVPNFLSFVIVILFDYVFAFGILGTADFFVKITGKRKYSYAFSSATVVFLRFLCHLVSGICIWSVYAPEGQSPLLYSLIYNGSYMIPELIITTLVAGLTVSKIVNRNI